MFGGSLIMLGNYLPVVLGKSMKIAILMKHGERNAVSILSIAILANGLEIIFS